MMKKNLYLFVCLLLGGIGNLSPNKHDVPTYPPLLKKRDRIAIVAPATKAEDSKSVIQQATEILQSWGLEVLLGKYM